MDRDILTTQWYSDVCELGDPQDVVPSSRGRRQKIYNGIVRTGIIDSMSQACGTVRVWYLSGSNISTPYLLRLGVSALMKASPDHAS